MASHGVPRIAEAPAKTQAERNEELEKIENYQALVDLLHSRIEAGEYTPEVLALTSKLLTKNPEYYTIWNIRRRLLLANSSASSESAKFSDVSSPSKSSHNSSQTDSSTLPSETSSSSTSSTHTDSNTIQQNQSRPRTGSNGTIVEALKTDLVFLVPLLKKWPKCYWIWNHRIWLLQQATKLLEVPVARKFWSEELALCSMMLVRDSRNFHGWGYRRMVVEQLESPALEGKSMVEEEFTYTTKMVTSNLSNFSAWHNRSELIPRLLGERSATHAERLTFLNEEFDTMRNALWTDASDQSLWFYHRFLMITLLDPSATTIPGLPIEERHKHATQQIEDLKEMLDGEENAKWIYHGLFEYTLMILKMLRREPTVEETKEMETWLRELKRLDPLRKGRWQAKEEWLLL